MTYLFLATGFEEVEALAPIDVLRRAGEKVVTVSVTGEQTVVGAHGVPVVADCMIGEVDFASAKLLVLPGGLPGATNLDECEELRQGILVAYQNGCTLAAICAAPLVYGHMGLLAGVNATCYPGFEAHMKGANYTAAMVQVDGQFITGCGPAAALEFGYALLERLQNQEASAPLREGMMYNKLMK